MTVEEKDSKRAKTTLSALPATRERLAEFANRDETVDQTLNRLMDAVQSMRVRARNAYETRTAAAKADPRAWAAGAKLADMLADRAAARQAAKV
ncbi:hypothetical protein ACIP5Y_09750 [Nocardia sp. NPDC088792]|uniref:hypothetical protein n=1 Tax=Nocardia sp. NPDC088792 TaxID=3364332 RepID=UPI00380A8EA1